LGRSKEPAGQSSSVSSRYFLDHKFETLNAHDAVPLLVLLHLWLFLSAVNAFDLSTAYENALYSMIDGQDVVLLEFA
jgi:hypothetical protein